MRMPELSDAERFIEYLRLSQGQINGYIFAIVQDRHDMQDIFQQTSLILWQKFDSFDGHNFTGWACRTAQLVSLGHLRSKRRNGTTFSDEIIEKLTESAVEAGDLSSVRREALEQCLKKLSDSDRELVDLCYTRSQTVKSIAEQWNRPPQSISNSLRRIRRGLSECIHKTLVREERS